MAATYAVTVQPPVADTDDVTMASGRTAVAAAGGRPWRLVGPVTTTVGALVVVVASFQRWLITGSSGRSSFELLGVVQRLGFVPNGAARMVVRLWPVMPLLLTAGVVTMWWGWRRVGAVFATLGAVFAGTVGWMVGFEAPDTRGIRLSDAPAATAGGAVIVVLGSLLAVLVRVPSADAQPR